MNQAASSITKLNRYFVITKNIKPGLASRRCLS